MSACKKPSIVVVYDSAALGSWGLYLNGSLTVIFDDSLSSYSDFLGFLDRMAISYEERDMPEDLKGEAFPALLENVKPKVSVHIEIDTRDEAEYLFIMTDDTNLGWVSKTDAIAIRDRLVEALGKC